MKEKVEEVDGEEGENKEHKKTNKISKNNKEKVRPDPTQKMKKDEDENILKIEEGLINRLNPTELYELSNLQIELETCNSVFSKVYMIGES